MPAHSVMIKRQFASIMSFIADVWIIFRPRCYQVNFYCRGNLLLEKKEKENLIEPNSKLVEFKFCVQIASISINKILCLFEVWLIERKHTRNEIFVLRIVTPNAYTNLNKFQIKTIMQVAGTKWLYRFQCYKCVRFEY